MLSLSNKNIRVHCTTLSTVFMLESFHNKILILKKTNMALFLKQAAACCLCLFSAWPMSKLTRTQLAEKVMPLIPKVSQTTQHQHQNGHGICPGELAFFSSPSIGDEKTRQGLKDWLPVKAQSLLSSEIMGKTGHLSESQWCVWDQGHHLAPCVMVGRHWDDANTYYQL